MPWNIYDSEDLNAHVALLQYFLLRLMRTEGRRSNSPPSPFTNEGKQTQTDKALPGVCAGPGVAAASQLLPRYLLRKDVPPCGPAACEGGNLKAALQVSVSHQCLTLMLTKKAPAGLTVLERQIMV